ncbi:major Facilitator Superfamily protein, partial [Vibrio cholerae HE-46]
GHVDCVD